MITYHQLQTFLAVARAGNLTRAARALNASQPTVSQQLRALRESLGAPLIERGPTGFRLTPAGEKLRRYAEETLGGLRAVQQEITALKGTLAGSLAVGVTFALSSYVLPAALLRFRALFPGIDVEVHVDLPEPLFRHLLGNTLDVACYLRVRTPSGLSVEPLGAEELIIITSPRHPLIDRQPISPTELSGQPLVVPAQQGFRELVEDKLRAAGVVPRTVIEARNNDAVLQLVEGNAGYYSMNVRPRVAAELATGRLAVVRLAGPPILGEIVAAFVARPVTSPLVEGFLRFLRGELADGVERGDERTPLAKRSPAGAVARKRSRS